MIRRVKTLIWEQRDRLKKKNEDGKDRDAEAVEEPFAKIKTPRERGENERGYNTYMI